MTALCFLFVTTVHRANSFPGTCTLAHLAVIGDCSAELKTRRYVVLAIRLVFQGVRLLVEPRIWVPYAKIVGSDSVFTIAREISSRL